MWIAAISRHRQASARPAACTASAGCSAHRSDAARRPYRPVVTSSVCSSGRDGHAPVLAHAQPAVDAQAQAAQAQRPRPAQRSALTASRARRRGSCPGAWLATRRHIGQQHPRQHQRHPDQPHQLLERAGSARCPTACACAGARARSSRRRKPSRPRPWPPSRCRADPSFSARSRCASARARSSTGRMVDEAAARPLAHSAHVACPAAGPRLPADPVRLRAVPLDGAGPQCVGRRRAAGVLPAVPGAALQLDPEVAAAARCDAWAWRSAGVAVVACGMGWPTRCGCGPESTRSCTPRARRPRSASTPSSRWPWPSDWPGRRAWPGWRC